MLIRIATPETKYSSKVTFYIGGVKRLNKDKTFDTVCLGLGRPNQFGRVESADAYTAYPKRDDTYSNVSTVKPLNDYEVFELTTNPKECVLLKIKNTVFGGHSYDNVVKVLGKKTFLVDEDLYIQGGRKANKDCGMTFAKSEADNNSGINVILKYKGLYHEAKENPRYEGERNTAIELQADCVYEMYKLVKKVLVVTK